MADHTSKTEQNNTTEQTNSDDQTRTAFFYGKSSHDLSADIKTKKNPQTHTGTLMEPQVFFSVCYQTARPPAALASHHTFTPAVLHGYQRRRVRAADYPGMTPCTSLGGESSTVFGMLVNNLTSANLDKLDRFEGAQYDRRVVRPRVLTTVGDERGEGNVEGGEVAAETYVFVQEDELEEREWDFGEFKREKMRFWTRGGIAFDSEC